MMMFGQTRIFFVMARDGLLPDKLASVHPRFRTPHVVTAVTGVGVMLAAAFLPVGKLADYSNSGTLFAFMMVAISVLVLRRTDPGRKRPFRTPAVAIVAPLRDHRLRRTLRHASAGRDSGSSRLGRGRLADLLRLLAAAAAMSGRGIFEVPELVARCAAFGRRCAAAGRASSGQSRRARLRLSGQFSGKRPEVRLRAARHNAGSPRRRRSRRAAATARGSCRVRCPSRKPAANRSPAPVVSTSLSMGSAGTVRPLAAASRQRTVLAARNDEDLDLVLDRRDGALEVRDPGKRLDLRLVGEQDVDPPARRAAR